MWEGGLGHVYLREACMRVDGHWRRPKKERFWFYHVGSQWLTLWSRLCGREQWTKPNKYFLNSLTDLRRETTSWSIAMVSTLCLSIHYSVSVFLKLKGSPEFLQPAIHIWGLPNQTREPSNLFSLCIRIPPQVCGGLWYCMLLFLFVV